MSYRLKQTLSGWFKLASLCVVILGFAFMGFNFYVASKGNSPEKKMPMITVSAPDLPVIDQTRVKETESALFALG